MSAKSNITLLLQAIATTVKPKIWIPGEPTTPDTKRYAVINSGGAWSWSELVQEDVELERSYLSSNTVTAGQDVNDNGAIAFTSDRDDATWDATANSRTYIGAPDRVRIKVNIHQRIADNINAQRPAPQVTLLRNGVTIARSSTGYIRDTNDHEDSSNTIAIIDRAPGTDPVYTLTSTQESTNGSVVSVVIGSFDLEAVLIQTKSVVVGVT